MNINFNIGSSETTREASCIKDIARTVIVKQFTFTNFSEKQPEHKKKFSSSFLQWFIGFSEGNECFYAPIIGNRERLCFEIAQKDAKLIYKIRTTLGFGKVISFTRNNETYWKYCVKDKKGLERIMLLFNGNLVLPKRYAQFVKWITSGQYILPKDFILKMQCVEVSLKTGWLSGFIEAQGCFYASFKSNIENSIIRDFNQTLIITQKDTCGESVILKQISTLFQETDTLHIARQPNYFRVSFSSLRSQTKIVSYINQFPLLGKKHITFHRWWRIYLRRQTSNTKPLSLKEEKRLRKLCSEINKTTNM